MCVCLCVCVCQCAKYLKIYEWILLKFFGEVERDPETDLLDFGGNPMSSSPSMPNFSPRNAFSLALQCVSYYSPDGDTIIPKKVKKQHSAEAHSAL